LLCHSSCDAKQRCFGSDQQLLYRTLSIGYRPKLIGTDSKEADQIATLILRSNTPADAKRRALSPGQHESSEQIEGCQQRFIGDAENGRTRKCKKASRT